jgi:hypothetical protein
MVKGKSRFCIIGIEMLKRVANLYFRRNEKIIAKRNEESAAQLNGVMNSII